MRLRPKIAETVVGNVAGIGLVAALILVTQSCAQVSQGGFAPFPGSRASLTSIDINMPRATDLQARHQEIDALIRGQAFGYHLQVTPIDLACPGATQINQVGIFEATTRLASTIRQGCDYNVTLELGSLGNGGRGLDRIFFRNEPALRVNKGDIAGRASLQAAISLKDLASNQSLDVIPNGNPSDPGSSQPNVPAFPPEKDAEVIDASGSRVLLSSVFKGEYLLLDFSQPGCGACVSMAKELSGDEAFHQAFGVGDAKCSHATVVPASQKSSWLGIFPVSGMIGSHSIFPEGGFSVVAEKLGRRITATPTFLLVDRAGNVIDSAAGNLPDKTYQVCGR